MLWLYNRCVFIENVGLLKSLRLELTRRAYYFIYWWLMYDIEVHVNTHVITHAHAHVCASTHTLIYTLTFSQPNFLNRDQNVNSMILDSVVCGFSLATAGRKDGEPCCWVLHRRKWIRILYTAPSANVTNIRNAFIIRALDKDFVPWPIKLTYEKRLWWNFRVKFNIHQWPFPGATTGPLLLRLQQLIKKTSVLLTARQINNSINILIDYLMCVFLRKMLNYTNHFENKCILCVIGTFVLLHFK